MEWIISRNKLIGTRHEKETDEAKKVCQDAYGFEDKFKDKGIYAIALADGMGSASYSQYGAEMSANAICEYLCNEDNFNIVFDAVSECKGQIASPVIEENTSKIRLSDISMSANIKSYLQDKLKEKLKELSQREDIRKKLEESGSSQMNIMQLASTLLFVAINGDRYITGHIGDGFIAALMSVPDDEEKAIPFSYPKNGEYANETFFVTDANMEENFELDAGSISEKGIMAFSLMSDGAADGLWNNREEKFLAEMAKVMRCNDAQIGQLLSLIKEKITDDDLSFISIVRKDTSSETDKDNENQAAKEEVKKEETVKKNEKKEDETENVKPETSEK